MRTVIFDLDGTLADTSADLIAAANACFRELGHAAPLDPVADMATAFRGGRAMLRLGFERLGFERLGFERLGSAPPAVAAEVEAQFPLFLDHYARGIHVHTALYPGAAEAVERLRAAGYRVGICTNKPQALAEALMRSLGVRELFAALIGADTLPVRKPDPAPYVAAVERSGGAVARSVLIGDTVTDRETARAAGVPCVLVGFGPEGGAVAALEPEAILPAYDALDETVARLIG